MKLSGEEMHRRKLSAMVVATALAGMLTLCGCPKKVPPPSLPPVASLTASPLTITRGQSSTLAWSTQNATQVTIDPLGRVDASGSDIVNPIQTTTYSLTATGPGGTAHASVQITVTQPSPTP
jgi:hypothetical protein